jgi:hypothetical protein
MTGQSVRVVWQRGRCRREYGFGKVARGAELRRISTDGRSMAPLSLAWWQPG